MTDFQFFTGPGVWCKPEGAERVDVILRGGDAGPSVFGLGEEGEIVTRTFDAADLADEIPVTGGGGDGGGYAVIISRKRAGQGDAAGCERDIREWAEAALPLAAEVWPEWKS